MNISHIRKNLPLVIALCITVSAGAKTLLNENDSGVMLDGYDPVAFFVENEPVGGSYEYASEYEGGTYHFSSEKNKQAFDKSPAKYVPQYGGFCAVSTSMGMVEDGNVDTWSIVGDKLYLQRNQKALGMWKSKGPEMFIRKANQEWPKLVEAYGSNITYKQINERMELTYEAAKDIAEAALAYENQVNAPGGAVAVVDSGGEIIILIRPEGTFAAAARVAHEKARTAAMFRFPSKNLEDAIVGGRTSLITVGHNMLRGGLPIYYKGQVVGGVGVSGAASADQDLDVAVAGLQASFN